MAAATDSHLAGPEVIAVGYVTLAAGAAAIGGFLFVSAFFAAVAIFLAVRYIRETRGCTLEQM